MWLKLTIPVPAPNEIGLAIVPATPPAPMLTVPPDPAFAAITMPGAVTAPPSRAVRTFPVLARPTVRVLPLVQVEPVPVTVTVLFGAAAPWPMKALPAKETAPPAETVTALPPPSVPTRIVPVLVQAETGPVTVTELLAESA